VTPAVLIAGPTASGKSQLALRLAEALEPFGGARIINADSMQVYHELRIVTARPTPADEARVPHRLYGALSAREVCSAGRWRALAVAEIAAAQAAGSVPIVVGGTGMYLSALLNGIAPVPPIPDHVRAEARRRMERIGHDAFRADLAHRDAESAASIKPNDLQRLVRAWEVVEATGTPLPDWRRRDAHAGFAGPLEKLLLLPERELVYASCDARVGRMVAEGVFAEVCAFDALDLADDLPATRAIGLREFGDWVRGHATEVDAINAVRQSTRRYAKRQFTWFRNQCIDWKTERWPPDDQAGLRRLVENMVASLHLR
jgi:tRNA dimethylallyltransferase